MEHRPFLMSVKSVRVTDGVTNSSIYTYGDHSGHWDSIQIEHGESEAYKEINKLSSAQKARKQWEGLSTGAKIGIACAILGALLIGAIAFAFYCIKQRKAGRIEKAQNDAEWEKQNQELMEYRTMMAKGNFAVSRQSVMLEVNGPKPDSQARFSRLSGRF